MQITGLEVRGDSGKTYKVRAVANGAIYCSCPAWKNQRLRPSQRSCKHIVFAREQMTRAQASAGTSLVSVGTAG
jgi:hypothetical protein